MKAGKVIVHTDIIADHLTGDSGTPSLLRRALQSWLCYTTVFNAMELFACVKREREKQAVRHALAAVKILGLNAKGAPRYGELMRTGARCRNLNILIAGMAMESRLPVFTALPEEFRWVKGLTILGPRDLPASETSGNV